MSRPVVPPGWPEEVRPPDTPDWELAFTHAVHAHAAHAAGRAVEHKASHTRAVAALQAVADPEDRRIVAATLDRVPAP